MTGIKDVAAAAKVSIGTVSNVLNGRHGKMRPETRQRVLDAIESLGYTPSVAAQQLKSGRSRTLGLIVPSVANPFWGAVSHHIEHAAAEQNYMVLVCNAERDPTIEAAYAETLRANAVHGMIFASSPMDFEHLRTAVERGVRIAAFDRRSRGALALVSCSVGIEQEMGGKLAGRHLIGLGHRRIGFISGPLETSSRKGRLKGLQEALTSAGLGMNERHVWARSIVPGFGDTEGSEVGRIAVRELLMQPDPPTAVFCINDMYALGAYAGARDVGARVPEDLSVIGFDDIVFSEIMQPALTTIRQPIKEMAAAVVRALVHELEGDPDDPEAPERHVQVTPSLIVRASTAPPGSTQPSQSDK